MSSDDWHRSQGHRRVVIRGGIDDGEEFWLTTEVEAEPIWSVPVSGKTYAENLGHFLRVGTNLTRHVLVGEDDQGRLIYEPREIVSRGGPERP